MGKLAFCLSSQFPSSISHIHQGRDEAMPKNHILNFVVLIALVAATLAGWLWAWGLFFIYLSYQAYVDEVTFVVTPISKADMPTLYWVVSAFWFLIGASYLFLI